MHLQFEARRSCPASLASSIVLESLNSVTTVALYSKYILDIKSPYYGNAKFQVLLNKALHEQGPNTRRTIKQQRKKVSQGPRPSNRWMAQIRGMAP